MTLLVGNSTVTGYTTGTFATGLSGTRLVHDSWTATTSGTATSLYFYSRDNNGNNVKLCIYSSGGVLLGYTSGMVNSEGWITGALNQAVTITSGQVYKLGWYTDAGYGDYYTDSGGTVSRDDAGSYTTPATTITSTGDAGINRFLMYADGTVGGGNYTLVADQGQITYSGVANNLLISRQIIGELGVFSLTGIPASLNYSGSPSSTYTLTGEVGSFSLNGQDSTLLYSIANYLTWDRVIGNEGYRIEWGQTSGGPYPNSSDNVTNDETITLVLPYRTTWYARVAALVGGVPQDYSSELGFTSGIPDLNADVGTFTLTGNDVNLNKATSGTYTLVAETGSYTLTGVNTNLLYNRTLLANVGSLTLTGINTGLLYSNAPVSQYKHRQLHVCMSISL